ncbi:caspase family protein [Arthrobacter mobilis]|uniref:Caspase family protein n=1 Tax=Arthrobacter mobilis TaxID=2724944 RepID=A0A7X6HC22_9MICC|nr:caspase family protein [Arthrobacter mobilis]NKX52967.1 caspase family protein [Arthrobacter mobilis]
MSTLSPEQLAALKPHVVNLRDGKVADRGGGAGLTTTADDVRAIFAEHLPRFAAAHGPGPVPLVIYAHGGLVDKDAGLRIAQDQVAWWQQNGAYPIHFVWETGLAGSIWDALKDWVTGGRRGWLDEARDRVLELAARFGQGQAVWEQMKNDAAAASADDGGARLFAAELGRYCTAQPGRLSVHAVGHSAGSIFHAHFIPAALASGVPEFATVSLLAPAVRTDLFKDTLQPEVGRGIKSLAMFTMNQELEREDNCVGLYGKSLLYLVRASFEPEEPAPILGLQESVRSDAGLAGFFGAPGTGARAEVVWSLATGGGRNGCLATTHGGFDNDVATMDSVARRVLGTDTITSYPARRAAPQLWPSPAEVRTAALPALRPGSRRRALCIGIDEYPGADRLYGCVADAAAWRAQLETAGFEVRTLLNGEATRQNILLAILGLVSTSMPGDVLAVQYAGHGTYVDDLDQDEQEAGNAEQLKDEALCPVDFREGRLVIDDDLAKIWEVLPEGVSLTAFFDSCHSGDAQRRIQPLSAPALAGLRQTAGEHGRRARFVVLDQQTTERYRALRGNQRTSGARARAREVLFSACRPTEVAYETGGRGDFSSAAVPLVGQGIGQLTNEQFHARVMAAFAQQPRQNPELHSAELLRRRTFLAPVPGIIPSVPAAGTDSQAAGTDGPQATETDSQQAGTAGVLPGTGLAAAAGPAGARPERTGTDPARQRALVAFLRAAADLLDS